MIRGKDYNKALRDIEFYKQSINDCEEVIKQYEAQLARLSPEKLKDDVNLLSCTDISVRTKNALANYLFGFDLDRAINPTIMASEVALVILQDGRDLKRYSPILMAYPALINLRCFGEKSYNEVMKYVQKFLTK